MDALVNIKIHLHEYNPALFDPPSQKGIEFILPVEGNVESYK